MLVLTNHNEMLHLMRIVEVSIPSITKKGSSSLDQPPVLGLGLFPIVLMRELGALNVEAQNFLPLGS